MESQDQQDSYFKVFDGYPIIDLYDTQTPETINIVPETIKITSTTDISSPTILTSQDSNGNQYAFNPAHGWFRITEVNMDCANLQKYTEESEDYFYDGRNNIVRSLRYANGKDKIPDTNPVFWVPALGNTYNSTFAP